MNKKEISEIKKQFTPANCAITKIAGCYVNGDKEKVTTFKDAFLSLSEEEIFKYFEIFRKVLSGTIGKNLMNMDFPLEAEKEGGTHSFLMKLRDSHLSDDTLLDAYYDQVVSNYSFGEHYLILVIHAAYDVPGKAHNNEEMFDASDEVFNFVMSCICPVSLAKPALSYDGESKSFRNRVRDWIVDMPQIGFMFPAFNERSTDIHSLLYYSKSATELHFEFTDALLGTELPLDAGTQKDVFTTVIEETLGETCSFEVAKSIHDKIHQITQEQKDSPDPVIMDQGEIKNILYMSGANDEKMEDFDDNFEREAGEKAELAASNIQSARKFEVKTPDVVISVSPDRSDLVERRVIDGRPYLVIPITDTVQVNGITVREHAEKPED